MHAKLEAYPTPLIINTKLNPAGQPITITALGGSVTAGSGVWRSQNSWTARFFSWVNETFPHKDHVFLNKVTDTNGFSYIGSKMNRRR